MVKYLITSGNSRVGRAAVKELRARGATDIVAGARDPVKSEKDLKDAGASSVVELDLNKKETVEKALEGVERVLIVHDGRVDFPTVMRWAQTVVEAATKPGSTVKVIGKVAAIFADSKSERPVVKLHGDILNLLVGTGLKVFQIGPSFFFENWFDQLDVIKTGVIRGAAGNSEFCHIAVEDIGAAAASLLVNPQDKFLGKHLGIASDVVSEIEIAKAISEATGKPLRYEIITIDEFKQLMIDRNYYSVDLAVLREQMKIAGALSRQVRTPDLLKEIIGRPPLTASAWAHAHKDEFLQ